MRKKLIFVFAIVLVVSVSTSLAISAIDKNKKNELFREVQLFSDTLAIIETDYVDETKPKDLIYGALKGMLSSLDPHSQFMDPDTYNELKVDTEGKFGGLGIEITIKDSLLTVVTPIEDTPAWKAGIKANDRIVKINNELTRDMSLTDAVKKMRGRPGEAVNITVLRESENKLLEFKIVRDIIKVKDVKEARILEDGIGYIRLIEFRENTPQDINAALQNLSRAGMSAIILDLRNNPGGLLDVAVRVAERFIEKGKMVVYTKGRLSSQNLEFISSAGQPLVNLPMVVLINEGSASGSEIVAGCLQDYKRAIVVGVKSFGKGSVQTVIPLSDGSAIRLTTSKYFTPLGKEIHGKGVIPDVVVEEGKIEITQKAQDIFEKLDKDEKANVNKENKPLDYKSDNQLMRAVDILKAIKIYKGVK
ncbi:MAG: S41 family peptidase [Candidatus Omnitrophica bacterium]|nr:S41 family peptidase [Candidatus Omnitrophota bacterium]MDD5592579.1 S41 family peptidase [Candidatus Omnitrophota bacterium]